MTIDPSFTRSSSSDQYDTYINSGGEYYNYYNNVYLRLGMPTSTQLTRSYVQHILNNITGSVISASYHAYEDTGYTSTSYIDLHRVTESWTSTGITWHDDANFDSYLYSYNIVNHAGWYTYNLTKLVSEWYKNTYPNYGFILKDRYESTTSRRYRRFVSSDGSTKPYFTVSYTYAPTTAPSVSVSYASNGSGILNVSWSPITNANHYHVYNGSTLLGETTSATTSIQLTNIYPGTYNIRIRVANQYDHLSSYSPYCATKTVDDHVKPPLPTTFTAIGSFSGETGTITVDWSDVTDLPSAGASGLYLYEVGISINGGAYSPSNVLAPTSIKTYTNCADNTTYRFRIRTKDAHGNYSSTYKYSDEYYSPDKTGPDAPTSVSITPSGWTNDTSPLVAWSGIIDEGNHLNNVQYKIDSGAWTPTGSTTYTNGAFTLSGASLSEGAHTISIRGVDSSSNVGASASATYYKDTDAPEVSLEVSDLSPEGIIYIKATITNGTGSGFSDWALDYGLGNPASTFNTPVLASGTSLVNDQVIYEWDTSNLTENNYYTLRLTAKDSAVPSKNARSTYLILLKASGSVEVNAALQIDQPEVDGIDGYQPDINNIDQYAISSPETDVTYQRAEDGGISGLLPGKLYVSNQLHDEETSAGEGFTFNAADYDNGWTYPEGSIAFIYVQTEDSSGNELYSTGTMEALEITDTFNDQSKIESLINVNQASSQIVLDKWDGVNYYASGSFESTNEEFAGDISYIDLIVDQNIPSDGSIEYKVSVDNGNTWSNITPVSTDGGFTVDTNNRKYFTTNPIGDSVKLRAIVYKSTSQNSSPTINSWSINVRYTTYANAVLIDNTFPLNARGITNLVSTEHDKQAERIRLAYGVGSAFAAEGTIQSTVRYSSNDVISVCLEVDETINPGTDIVYKIYTNGKSEGENGQTIEPGLANNNEDWIEITNPGSQIVIEAILSGDGLYTPLLNSWKLVIKEKIAGEPHLIKLVDEPWNLSALTNANYMTLLRWEESDTDDVTYNVYRSTTPHFEPSEENRVAENLAANSWSDYNLNYGQEFFYKVTAVKVINGHERESLPSNEDNATIVSEGEMNKRLGLQDYWSYSGFNTGSGTGYVNVSNGNLSYITTDMVLPDPFLAVVMRRTYNSLADTTTPMGNGWDFSLNTRLMRAYDVNGDETGMILKDGDGSFHIFAKNLDGTYQSAKGTLMVLTHDTTLGEYQIRRKDNIVYHFDDQSMRLDGFSDNNGNTLSFDYDNRGNLKTVENTVGDIVELDYYVVNENQQIVQITDPDYSYINYHPDMLKSITWTEDTAINPVTISYTYEYDDDFNKLTRAYTVIENSVEYEEVFSYDPQTGELLTITDPEGNSTGISYDANDRIDIITDACEDANTYDFDYLSNNTSITSKYDTSVSYIFDSNGQVTSTTNPMGHTINYSYNNDLQVTSASYLNYVDGGSTPETVSTAMSYVDGNLETITAADGTVTTYSNYNSFNKPLSMSVSKSGETTRTTTYTYDTATGNLLTATDPEGKTTTNVYETVNGDPGYLTWVINDFDGKTHYIYNSKGQVEQVDAYIGSSYEYTSVSYAYDYNEDGFFQRVIATDALGIQTKTYYDRLGRTVKVVSDDDDDKYETASYDLVGNVRFSVDRMGYETEFQYDELNRLEHIIYPDDTISSIEYLKWNCDDNTNTGYGSNGEDADKVIRTAEVGGVQNIEYYDIAGRLVKTAISNGTGEIVTAHYEYDLIGNCTKVTDNAGRVSEAHYNELNQTTQSIVDPTGENIQSVFTYDMMGNNSSTTNGEGYTTTYSYDLDSRLDSVSQTINVGTQDEEDLITSYAYDIEDGGYIKNRVTDANGHVNEAWFDALGRKLFDYNIGDAGDSITIQTGYEYYDNGQIYLVTRNDGTKEKYTYTNLCQLKRIDYYESSESIENDSDDYVYYEYNDNGQLLLSSVYHDSDEVSTAYTYDSKGRTDTITEGDLNNGGLIVDYDYDASDRVTQISYAKDDTQRKLGYVYDTFGRIWEITLALGTETPELVREYSYKTNGDLDSIKNYRNFENDGTEYIELVYELNNAGMTSKITYTDHAATQVKKEEYILSYDKRGYITDETIYTNYDSAQTVIKSFDYDEIGRLETATVGSQTTSYTYDSVGNRESMDDETDLFEYTYNQFNQLETVTKNSSDYLSYSFDDLGNQVEEVLVGYLSVTVGETTTTYDRETSFDYNLMNRLSDLEITTPEADELGNVTYDVVSTTNTYNAAGQRVKRLEDGYTTKYYYSGSALLFTTNIDNHLLTENILDLGGNIVASLRFDAQNPDDPFEGDFYFYNYDCRGSTTSIIAPDGTLTTGYSYDEFGNQELTGSSSFLNEVTFTGSVSDISSGLQYMNARFYNPTTGRFLSQDTYSGNAYDPWTQHLYAYCGNNPVNMIDPTGHSAEGIFGSDLMSQIQGAIQQIGISISNQKDKFLSLKEGCWADGGAPFADIAMGVGALALLGYCVYEGVNTYSQTLTIDKPAAVENDDAKAKEAEIDIVSEMKQGNDIHHIVAQKSPYAVPARLVLESVNIDPKTNPLNLVPVPRTFHRIMHTKGYYDYVNIRLSPYEGDLDGVIMTLASLAAEIEFRAYTGNRWPGKMDFLVFD